MGGAVAWGAPCIRTPSVFSITERRSCGVYLGGRSLRGKVALEGKAWVSLRGPPGPLVSPFMERLQLTREILLCYSDSRLKL